MARHLNPQGREPLLLARDTVVLRTWMESPLVFFSCFLTAWLSRDCMTEQSNESLGILSRISGGGSSGDHVRRELKTVFSDWGGAYCQAVCTCIWPPALVCTDLHSDLRLPTGWHNTQARSKRLWEPNWHWNHSHRGWVGNASLNLPACWLSGACENRAEQNNPHSP